MCVSDSLCSYSGLLSDHLPPSSLQTHNVLKHEFHFACPRPLNSLATLGNPFSVAFLFCQPLPLAPQSRSRSSEEEPNQTNKVAAQLWLISFKGQVPVLFQSALITVGCAGKTQIFLGCT